MFKLLDVHDIQVHAKPEIVLHPFQLITCPVQGRFPFRWLLHREQKQVIEIEDCILNSFRHHKPLTLGELDRMFKNPLGKVIGLDEYGRLFDGLLLDTLPSHLGRGRGRVNSPALGLYRRQHTLNVRQNIRVPEP